MSEVGFRGLRRKVPSRAGHDQPLYPDPTKTVSATFHENSVDRFFSEFRGQHGTSIAFTSLLINATLPVHTWTDFDLDNILDYGASLHREFVKNPIRKQLYLGQPELTLQEMEGFNGRVNVTHALPVGMDMDMTNEQLPCLICRIYKSKFYYGKVHSTSGSKNKTEVTMETAVNRILENGFQTFLISVDGRTGALMTDEDGNLRFFYPYCCNKVGRRAQVGSAVLLSFENKQDFIKHIRKRLGCSDSKFELLGLKVKKQPPRGNRRIRGV